MLSVSPPSRAYRRRGTRWAHEVSALVCLQWGAKEKGTKHAQYQSAFKGVRGALGIGAPGERMRSVHQCAFNGLPKRKA